MRRHSNVLFEETTEIRGYLKPNSYAISPSALFGCFFITKIAFNSCPDSECRLNLWIWYVILVSCPVPKTANFAWKI
jgi:hypothetical protein